MCAACAAVAVAAASGTRSWLQAHHMSWLTPRRLRAITITLFAVAAIVSSVGISGSSKPAPAPVVHHATAP